MIIRDFTPTFEFKTEMKVPKLPKQIINLMPNAYKITETNHPINLENEKDEKIINNSLFIWYSCDIDEDFPLETPYASSKEDATLLECIKTQKRTSLETLFDGEIPWYINFVSSYFSRGYEEVLSDFFHFPCYQGTDLYYILGMFTDNIVPKPPLYLPLYEHFFYVTRGFIRPINEYQAQLIIIATENKDKIPIVDNLFYDERLNEDIVRLVSLDMSDIKKKLGVINDNFVYMIGDYIFSNYQYIPVEEEIGETLESLSEKLIKWKDEEIENYYGASLPFNKKFTSRINMINHFITINSVIA